MNSHLFLRLRPAVIGAVVLLFVAILLGALAQWGFAFAFLIMVILFLLTLFVFWAVLRANRDAGLGDNNLPFTFNPIYRSLYSIVDPRPSRSATNNAEQYQGELQPIVFRDHTEMEKSDVDRKDG
jgi:ABC-type transport system involved in cytochrome bd biosynthesis fused ATPase/permease subunit